MRLSSTLCSIIRKLPRFAVYALINEEDKRVYLTYSSNFVSSFTTLYKSIFDMSNGNRKLVADRNKLEVVILDSFTSSTSEQKLLVGVHGQYYRNRGYSLYRERPSICYSVRVSIEKDYLVHVSLVSRNRKRILVGVFDSKAEADSFVTDYYEVQDYVTPVYSINNLTKKFLL